MNNSAAKNAAILIASDKSGDAALVEKLLDEEFGNLHLSTKAGQAVADFEQHAPQVLVLAFDTLEKAEGFLLVLYRQSRKIHALPHRCITLCSTDQVRQAYAMCRNGHFDDYVLFWPMAYDSPRLLMAVHIALRELAALRDSGASQAEIAGHAQRLVELEALLTGQLAQGGRHIDLTGRLAALAEARIGGAVEGLAQRLARGELSDSPQAGNIERLAREIARIKAEDIEMPLRNLRQSIAPLTQWAKNMTQEMQPQLESARSMASLARGTLPVVLVVDDEPIQREIIGTVLAESYRVLTAGGGREALGVLRKTPADLILMDINMADMDGLQTTRQIKAMAGLARVPIIMISGFSDTNVVRECIKAGAIDFIVKPIEPTAMLVKITHALRQAAA